MDFSSARLNDNSEDNFPNEIHSHSEDESKSSPTYESQSPPKDEFKSSPTYESQSPPKDESESSSICDISSGILRLEDDELYNSMRECEEYFEMEEQKLKEKSQHITQSGTDDLLLLSDGTEIKNINLSSEDTAENTLSKEVFSFIDFIDDGLFKDSANAVNNESIREIEDLYLENHSDLSSKRHKSSSSIVDIENSFIERKSESSKNIPVVESKSDGNKIFTGFMNAKDEKILIDESKVQMAFENNKDDYVDEKIPSEFIEELISSLREESNDTEFSFDEYSTQEIDNFKKTSNVIESMFKTGKDQAIMVDLTKVAECPKDCLNDEYMNTQYQNDTYSENTTNIQSDLIVTGFTTGKNQKISVNVDTFARTTDASKSNNERKSSLKSNGERASSLKTNKERASSLKSNGDDEISSLKSNSSVLHYDIHSTGTSKTSLLSTYERIDENGIVGIENKFKNILNENSDSNMEQVYDKILEYFKKEDKSWIFHQFKWTWLHLFVNKITEKGNISEEIIEIMKLKLKYERSILRRIVEFDDVSFRFMVLGIIDFSENWIELFDGFYSVRAEIDRPIYRMLRQSRCSIGSRLYVFGAQILLKEPRSIFDVTECVLRLFYNSTKVCFANMKLGRCKKISFLNTISLINPSGGIVSALLVKIKKIIEVKYYVTVENYRNRVDDIEEEIEKIFEIATRTGHKIDIHDINIRQYCKVIIEDRTGECLLTWWSPPEIKEKEEYKFVYLNTLENTVGIHLTTTKQTYFEKMLSKK